MVEKGRAAVKKQRKITQSSWEGVMMRRMERGWKFKGPRKGEG